MKKLLGLLFSASFCFACAPKDATPPPENKPAPVSDEVRLSPIAQQRFRLTSVHISNKLAKETLATTGEIKADENRVFHINSLTSGRVRSDLVNLGDTIKAGQTLAVIENLEVIKIYSEYIHQTHKNDVDIALAETRLELARKSWVRIKRLFEERIAAEKDLIKAEADLKIEQQTSDGLKSHTRHLREETKALLNAYGVAMPDDSQETIASTSPIITPKSGVVTKKNVTVGDVVSSTDPLYVIADLSKVWLDIAVYDKQLSSVRKGSLVTFSCDSLPDQKFSGIVTYIKPATEENSGTFLARVELSNPKLILKPGMLGKVTVENDSQKSLPFIPEAAIQRDGEEVFVFLDLGNGKYKKRKVKLGTQIAGGYLAEGGLSSNDNVVTEGSFALKAEMLKSTLAEEE